MPSMIQSSRSRAVSGILGAVLLLAPLACRSPRNSLAEWMPSPNFNARRPQLVVIHHTAGNSFEYSLKQLKTHNDGGPVSAHYLIGRDGRKAQLVSDDDRAWHAGTGTWGPYRDINSLSIGIELDNNGSEPFPSPQIDALLILRALKNALHEAEVFAEFDARTDKHVLRISRMLHGNVRDDA